METSTSPARCEITCSTSFFCQGERFPRQSGYIVLYWILFIVGTNLLSNAITLGASIGFAALLQPKIFGQQRVFGTIGFGLSAFAASRAYAYFKTELVYIVMFSIATTLCILVTSAIRIQDKRDGTSQNRKTSEQEMEDVVTMKTSAQETGKEKKTAKSSPFKAAALIPLLKRTDVIVFLSLTLIWGTSYAALDPVRIQGISFFSFEHVETGKDQTEVRRTPSTMLSFRLVSVSVHRRNRSMWITFHYRFDVVDRCLVRSGGSIPFRTYARMDRHERIVGHHSSCLFHPIRWLLFHSSTLLSAVHGDNALL